MISTMKLRMLRAVLVYRAGDVLPIVPRGQALEWIRQGVAEEIVEEASSVPVAGRSESQTLETAALEPMAESASYSHRKKRGR